MSDPHQEAWKDNADGTAVIAGDPWLENWQDSLRYRFNQYKEKKGAIEEHEGGLENFSQGYTYFGLIPNRNGINIREWAPGAKEMFVFGDFNGWSRYEHRMEKDEFGVWSIFLNNKKDGSPPIAHGSKVKYMLVSHYDHHLERNSAWAKYVVQNPETNLFDACLWNPEDKDTYKWKHQTHVPKPKSLKIYECHVGMSSCDAHVASYDYFTDWVLPRVKRLGYNAVQIMAIMEHAYYGSFGYHVTNFFAVSSRSGTPEGLKRLIDTAHSMGITVLMDIVHSHASSNEMDGIGNFDGSGGQYFHEGGRGYHSLWDSKCFDYGKWEVMRFLLSNLRFWVDEYHFDGFRFDGVTSMLYTHHGIHMSFSGNYDEYFGYQMDVDANVYLMLANEMLHDLYPDSMITIGEDVSGMPTLCRPVHEGGIGFDYRLAMAIPDVFIELFEKVPDEHWNIGHIVHTLTNRRWNEKTIAYFESHDQALVGDKTMAMWLMNADMYYHMEVDKWPTEAVERGIAMHKTLRLLVYSLGGEGYLNFMGNEFGHPEWIDFPREGNGFSYNHARRRWDLPANEGLRFKFLEKFDELMHAVEAEHFFCREKVHQYVVLQNEEDKVIVVEKGDRLVFCFNLHPWKQYDNYRVGTNWRGKYKTVLDSDSWNTGGGGRVTWDDKETSDEGWNDRKASLFVTIPPRSAQVYYCYEWYDEGKEGTEKSAEVSKAKMSKDGVKGKWFGTMVDGMTGSKGEGVGA